MGRGEITSRDMAAFGVGANAVSLFVASLAWWRGIDDTASFAWPLIGFLGFLGSLYMYLWYRLRDPFAERYDARSLLADRLRRRAVQAQALLMAGRPADAAAVLDALWDDVDGVLDDINEALDAAAAENVPAAICHLERFLSPSPARIGGER